LLLLHRLFSNPSPAEGIAEAVALAVGS